MQEIAQLREEYVRPDDLRILMCACIALQRSLATPCDRFKADYEFRHCGDSGGKTVFIQPVHLERRQGGRRGAERDAGDEPNRSEAPAGTNPVQHAWSAGLGHDHLDDAGDDDEQCFYCRTLADQRVVRV